MSVAELTAVIGWCAVINYGLLLFSSLFLIVARDWTMSLHTMLMGVDREQLPRLYFDYLGHFKLLIIVFNIVPWIALKIVF